MFAFLRSFFVKPEPVLAPPPIPVVPQSDLTEVLHQFWLRAANARVFRIGQYLVIFKEGKMSVPIIDKAGDVRFVSPSQAGLTAADMETLIKQMAALKRRAQAAHQPIPLDEEYAS
jgi:hypothetical protein